MSPKLLAGLGESPQYKSLIGTDRWIWGREQQREEGREKEGQRVKWLLSGGEGPGAGKKGGRGGRELEGGSHANSEEVPHPSFCFDAGCVGGGEGEGVRREGGEWVGVRTPAASSPVSSSVGHGHRRSSLSLPLPLSLPLSPSLSLSLSPSLKVPFMRRCLSESQRKHTSVNYSLM